MILNASWQSLVIKIVTVLVVTVIPVAISYLIYLLATSFLPTDLANKELFSGITSALVVFSLSKIVELFITATNRKFKHLSSLNKSLAYINKLNYSVGYDIDILKARESSIVKMMGSFYSNELELLPLLDDYETKFSIINLEIINKSEALSYFINHCNRVIATNNVDYISLKKYFNELKDKLSDDQRKFYCEKFIENTQKAIGELEKLKIDLLILITMISSRFDKDYKDLDIWFFNLFFPEAKEKATSELLINKFKNKIGKELKVDDNLSKKIIDAFQEVD